MIKKFYKKVIAQRPEDLSIISALCSQAKVKQSDIKYLKNNKVFILTIERTNKERSTHDVQGLSTSRYAKQYSMIYDGKYNVTDAAFVKAGHLTGNKLYDHCLGNKPLPHDCTIRFISMKIKYMNTIMRDKVTYGT